MQFEMIYANLPAVIVVKKFSFGQFLRNLVFKKMNISSTLNGQLVKLAQYVLRYQCYLRQMNFFL